MCFGFLSKFKKKTKQHYLDNIGNVGHDIAEREGFITENISETFQQPMKQ